MTFLCGAILIALAVAIIVSAVATVIAQSLRP